MAYNQMQNLLTPTLSVPNYVFCHRYTSRLNVLVDDQRYDDVINDEDAGDDNDNDSFGHVNIAFHEL